MDEVSYERIAKKIIDTSKKTCNFTHTMNIATTTVPDGTIIAVDGRIDTANCLEFELAVTSLLDKGIQTLFLDASSLSYISNSGLRIFLSIQKIM